MGGAGLPDPLEDEAVALVARREAVVALEIGGVGDRTAGITCGVIYIERPAEGVRSSELEAARESLGQADEPTVIERGSGGRELQNLIEALVRAVRAAEFGTTIRQKAHRCTE